MTKRYRPVLHIPRTQIEKLLEALTALGIITLLAMAVWGYLTLPAVIPTHFGFSGEPNAYGDKGNLLIVPIIAIVLAVLLTVLSSFLPRISTHRWPMTEENAPRQYYLVRLLLRWITLEMVWLFCSLQWFILQSIQSNHSHDALLLVIPAFLVAVIVTIILYIRSAARAR